MSNQLQTQAPKKFSVAIQGEGYKKLIANTLSDPKRAQRFIASVSSAVATNPALQDCEPGSILSSALLGEALNLSPSPQLGQYYMVPFNKKGKNGAPDTKIAQFQLGYKGYIQLATRSGFYKKINVLDIKAGELIHFDPLNEDLEIQLIEDEDEREAADTIGYYAMFEYPNGFRKAIYWSKKKMLNHADKYSQAFSKAIYEAIAAGRIQQLPKGKQADEGYVSSADLWKYSSFWYKSFDDMAFKTMLRHLISRWGVMSIEMTEAYTKDQAEIKPGGDYDYIDSTSINPQTSEYTDNEQRTIPVATGEEFAGIRRKYFAAVSEKKITPEKLIADLGKKHSFSEEQTAEITNWSIAND